VTLKELRKSKHLKQKDVAIVLGVNRSTVAKWENGSCCPSILTVFSLSEIFEISVEEVFNVIAN